MKKNHVLIVGALPPKAGGVVTVMQTVVRSPLICDRFEFATIDITSSSSYSRTDKGTFGVVNILRRLWQLYRLVWKVLTSRPQIVHYNVCPDYSFLSDTLNIFVLRLMGRHILMHYHNDPTSPETLFPAKEGNHWRARLFAATARKCDLCVVLGDKFREFLENDLRLTNVGVLYNCLPDLEDSGSNGQDEIRERMSILYLGRLSELKGTYDVLEVARMFHEKYYPAEFIIAGGYNSPEDKTKIEEFISVHGLSNVKIPGMVTGADKTRLLSSAKVFLFPSKYEAFPVSILEAAYFEVPSVVYDIGMMDEIVENRETGIVVRKNDVRGLFETLQEFLLKPDFAATLGRNAARDARERFSGQIFEETLFRYYLQIIKGMRT